MRKILLLLVILLSACSFKEKEIVVNEVNDNLLLPEKTILNNKMSDSPLNPANIDKYLFRDDCIYIDTRSPEQFYEEGSIAGFVNVPFYGYICDFKKGTDALFTFTKIDENVLLGDSGSFIPNYEESIDIINSIFPKDKYILAISTAGVESCYLLNLLEQLGYDASLLYNVGSFTTGMGKDIAYISYKDAKYLVKPFYLDDTVISFKIDGLNKIEVSE